MEILMSSINLRAKREVSLVNHHSSQMMNLRNATHKLKRKNLWLLSKLKETQMPWLLQLEPLIYQLMMQMLKLKNLTNLLVKREPRVDNHHLSQMMKRKNATLMLKRIKHHNLLHLLRKIRLTRTKMNKRKTQLTKNLIQFAHLQVGVVNHGLNLWKARKRL